MAIEDADAFSETARARAFKIIDTLPGFAWSATRDGRFSYVSSAALDYLGTSQTDLDPLSDEDEFGWRAVVHPDDYESVAARWRHCLKTGERYDTEHRLRRADGVYRWFRNSGAPVRDDKGCIVEWHGTTLDIDEQRQAQAALRVREQELSLLVDMAPSHIWRLTPDGAPTFFNKRMADYLGADAAALAKGYPRPFEGLLACIHPDDANAFGAGLQRSLTTGAAFALRYRLRRADGAYHWMSSRAEALTDESGAIVQWYGICHDIDELTRLHSEVAEREARIRRLVESDIIGIVIWDLDGRLIEANDAFLRMLQYDREDLKAGLRWLDMTPPEWQAVHAEEEAEELARTGKMQAREKEYFRKDGSRVPVLIGAACFEGQSTQGVAYILDLSERKRAEDALGASKQQLEQMIDALPVNILSFDPTRKLTYASHRYHATIGSALSEARDFEDLAREVAHPDDLPRVLSTALNGFAGGEPFLNRFRRRESDGVYRWIEARAQALREPSGAVVQWYIVSLDIEEEMQAQEALRERERFLWQLVETLPAMIDCAAPNGEPVYRSQQLREFLGYPLEKLDATGKTRLTGTLDAGVHADDVAGVKEEYAYSLRTGEPYARRHRLRRFDGEYRWVETRAAPMRDSNGAIVQWNVICLDIDGEVRAQEELRLAQDRLARAGQAASLAELSASIAHEVNQPLAAVVTNSHACQRWLNADPPNLDRAQRTVERIIRDANAAADVVSRVRALFRQTAGTRARASLAEVLAEARRLLGDIARKAHVRVDVALSADLPELSFDSVQIQQVLVNLARNAIEAMDGQTRERVLRIRVFAEDGVVNVEVSDTGPGMNQAEKAFDAFFTTKASGMGMGLAISRSIVEAHGGRLWIKHAGAEGTTLAFALPVDAGESAL